MPLEPMRRQTTDDADAAPLLVRALRCEPVERRPLWVMRQAGRYLPEYLELKAEHGFLGLANDPELAAQVTLLPFQRFAFDAAIVFADIMSPIASLGVDIRFAPGPVIDDPIRSRADIDRLVAPDAAEIAPEVVEALSIVRRRLDPEIATIGFAGAPLTLSAYLVQGHGKTDFPLPRAFAAADPAGFSRLLGRLAEVVAGYLRRQIEVGGAQAVQIFESWAGLLSARDWRHLVLPHLRDLLDEVGRSGAPRILFLNHAGPVLDAAVEAFQADELSFEALAVDWRHDLGALRQRLGPETAVQGNLDPAILFAGPETVRSATRDLLERVPRRGHVVNLGHGIQPKTPHDAVSALLETVHA
ncbi:MAG: uroporphyrinogen decarboxylase [Acidobacteriota bacterium]